MSAFRAKLTQHLLAPAPGKRAACAGGEGKTHGARTYFVVRGLAWAGASGTAPRVGKMRLSRVGRESAEKGSADAVSSLLASRPKPVDERGAWLRAGTRLPRHASVGQESDPAHS